MENPGEEKDKRIRSERTKRGARYNEEWTEAYQVRVPLPPKVYEHTEASSSKNMFHVRTGTLDVKALRKYRHIVNDCDRIPRSTRVEDILTTNVSEMEAVADRCNPFCLESERTE